MSTLQQSRMQQLARKNYGRLRMPRLLDGLSRIFGKEITAEMLVDLDRSDQMRTAARAAFEAGVKNEQPLYRLRLPQSGLILFHEEVHSLAALLSGTPVLVAFTKDFEDCGALQADAGAVLLNFEALLVFDGDDLLLGSADGSGLLVSFNADDPDEMCELSVWGPTWCDLALSSSRSLLNRNLNLGEPA